MGNVQSGSEDQKEPKSLRSTRSEKQRELNTRAPTLPLENEHGGSLTESVPFALSGGPLANGTRAEQDVRHAIRSALLAPADQRVSNQKNIGDENIDLDTIISALQQLKRTASPGDLIALQQALFPTDSFAQESPRDGKDGRPRSGTPASMDLAHLGSFDLGKLVVRNGAASPATTVDSVDLLRRQSGEGGPTAWAVASYMSTLSGSQHEGSQQWRQIEPNSTLEQPVKSEQIHQPATKRSGSHRMGKQHIRDSILLASEYIAEAGGHSPYLPSSRQSHETSDRSSQSFRSMSSHYSSTELSQRSSFSTAYEPRAPSYGNTGELEMHGHFADVTTCINLEERIETQASPAASMFSLEDISRPDFVQTQTGAAGKISTKSASTLTRGGTDPVYVPEGSTHRAPQYASSDMSESHSTSRTRSVSNSSFIENVERTTASPIAHKSPKSTLPKKSRGRLKIERITGESLEYLNYPIIGKTAQKVVLPKSSRSQLKLEKITGESIESLSYPVVGVVPHWQASQRKQRPLEGRQSIESMAESVTSEFAGDVKLKRSKSWKGSMRDSLQLIRSTPSSRSTSPERGPSDQVSRSSSKQRKKLQKRSPTSEKLSGIQIIDVPRVPTPVHSRFQKRVATSPGTDMHEQAIEDMICSKSKRNSMNNSLVLGNSESSTSFSDPESNLEQETQAPTLNRRPSFFRRGRKRDPAPKKEEFELAGVDAIGSALGGTPYDIAMSADNRKSLERLRSHSAGPKHPHHFANLSRPVSQEDVATDMDWPISPKSESAFRMVSRHSVDQSQSTPEEKCGTIAYSKRASVWNREIIAAANHGMPAELPAAFITGLPFDRDRRVEIPDAMAAELPGALSTELSPESQLAENVDYSSRTRTSWTSGRLSRNAFYPNRQGLSSPYESSIDFTTPNARPSSSPAMTVFYASVTRPAITLTSASPSPPPSPSQSPPRPKSAGNLSSTWKHKQRVPAAMERESAKWLKQAQILRERNLQARANSLKSMTVSAHETSPSAQVMNPTSTLPAKITDEKVLAQDLSSTSIQEAVDITNSFNYSPVLRVEADNGTYNAHMQEAMTDREATDWRSERSREIRKSNASTQWLFGQREADTSRRNFGVLVKTARVAAI